MRAAHDLGEGLPAIAVVDEDGVDSGCEGIESEQAEAERLARTGVCDDQPVMGRSELLVEQVEPEAVAFGRHQEACAARRAAPGGVQRKEVGGVPRSAALTAQLVGSASGQHREEGGDLRNVLIEQLRIADRAERAPRCLRLGVEFVGSAGLEQYAD